MAMLFAPYFTGKIYIKQEEINEFLDKDWRPQNYEKFLIICYIFLNSEIVIWAAFETIEIFSIKGIYFSISN